MPRIKYLMEQIRKAEILSAEGKSIDDVAKIFKLRSTPSVTEKRILWNAL